MTTRTVIDAAATSELAPRGRLRAGVIRAPEAGVFFVAVGADRAPRGVTADIFLALGGTLGLAVDFGVFPNSGECTDALARGEIDVAFMPVDDIRRAKVAFGPAYYLLRSTFLIAAGAESRTIAEYRERGKAFVGIAGTTTLRAAIRTFGGERASEARDVDEAVARFARGAVDAIALSEDYLRAVQPRFPGSVVMEDAFQETSISIAVPKDRPQASALVAEFLETAKAAAAIRRIFDGRGLAGEPVAPPGV